MGRRKKDFVEVLLARDIEILQRLAGGEEYKQISDSMDLHLNTMYQSMYRVMRVLKVANKTQAVAEALRQDLID